MVMVWTLLATLIVVGFMAIVAIEALIFQVVWNWMLPDISYWSTFLFSLVMNIGIALVRFYNDRL
jgi:hypothetical protein